MSDDCGPDDWDKAYFSRWSERSGFIWCNTHHRWHWILLDQRGGAERRESGQARTEAGMTTNERAD